MNKKTKTTVFVGIGIFILAMSLVHFLPVIHSDKPFCERIDKTQCFTNVKILNDSSQVLSVGKCSDNDCKMTDGNHILQPDDFYNTVVKPGVASEPWLVKDAKGKKIACLDFQFKENDPDSVVMPLSRASACTHF